MKKLFIASAFAFMSMSAFAQTQTGDKIGFLNQDGIFELTVDQTEGKQILKQHSLPSEAMPFEATDVSITTMADGTYSLTGYFRNPGGHIVKGFRIQCSQDDANNLIIIPGNKRERVIGRTF